MADTLDELDAWLDANWDQELTVAQWWQLLGEAGWAAPALPPNAYGKGLSRSEAIAVGHHKRFIVYRAAHQRLHLCATLTWGCLRGLQGHRDRKSVV